MKKQYITRFNNKAICKHQFELQPVVQFYIPIENKHIRQVYDEAKRFANKTDDDFYTGHSIIQLPGRNVLPHFHETTTVLYYPLTHVTPLIVNNRAIYPKEGLMVMLEPNVMHEVPNNDTDIIRFAVGFLFN